MSRLGRVGARRHGLHVARPLIAGLAALAALPLFGGLAGAHATTPRVVVQAPARAAVGQPITLHLAVRDARDVAGYETTLLLDSAAAHLAGTRQLHGQIARSGRGVVPLGPLTVGDRTSFGLYSCPVHDCATGTGRRHAAGVSGRVALGSVTVVPDRAGILELRLARTLVVDSHGRTVATRPTIRSGSRSARRTACSAPRLRRAASGPAPRTPVAPTSTATVRSRTRTPRRWPTPGRCAATGTVRARPRRPAPT